jgi:hypothetical protein
MRQHIAMAAALAAAALWPNHAGAQSLADRVASASGARVQFTYAGRPGVCGNGRTYVQVSGSMWFGSFNDNDRREPCEAGPVRVVVDRAGRDVVSIATFVGPLPERVEGVADLGRVRAADAAAYLMGLAERADGRVSRDALMPAVLADSTDPTVRLLTIARNQDASRETRRSAISWLGRPLDERNRAVTDIAAALVTIAKDEDDNQSVRQQSMRTLARLEHGTGTPALIELARDAQRSWLAREAMSSLNASGDPRAREYLRQVVRTATMSDEVLAGAIRGLGGEYATGADVSLIRASYPKLPGDRSREAAISSVATFGGTENVRWLLSIARNADQPTATRRRAVQHAWRGGTPIAELVKLYDETTDPQLKDAVMSVMVESGEKVATDKLMQIARQDASNQMRRKAVSHLSRSHDERVKQFLAGLVER